MWSRFVVAVGTAAAMSLLLAYAGHAMLGGHDAGGRAASPHLSASPNPLVWAPDERDNKTIRFTNTGNSNLTITSYTTPAPASGWNVVDLGGSGPQNLGGCYEPTVLAPGHGCTVTISFSGVNCTVCAHYFELDSDGGNIVVPLVTGTLDSSTTVASSANPTTTGTNVTYTATVSNTGGLGGSVAFTDNGSPLGSSVAIDANGRASVTTSYASGGSHTIVASYSGVSGDINPSSASLSETVQTATTTSVTSSTGSPVYGQPVTFTAHVSPSDATGTVFFFADGIGLGGAALSGGVANFTTSGLAVTGGTPHTITANYLGDATHLTGTGTLSGGQSVNKANVSVSIVPDLNPSYVGQPVTYTATLSVLAPSTATAPSGETMQFDYDASASTSSMTNGVATNTFTWTTPGSGSTHVFKAVYGGDGNFNAVVGTAHDQTVLPPSSTSTTLTSSIDPSEYGEGTTLTAQVTAGGVPVTSGTVTFYEGSTVIAGPVAVGGLGLAQANGFNTLSVGSHSLTARFDGTAGQAASTSAPLTQAITKSPVNMSADPPVTVSFGETAALYVYIFPPHGIGSPTGTVTYTEGSASLGTSSVSGGLTTFTSSTLGVGTHTIKATYGGDGSFSGASTTLTVTVDAVATTTTVSFGSGPFVYDGSPFTATATVSPGGGAATVSYSGDCTNAGSTCTATASYPGDATHEPSTSAPASITIEPAPVTAAAGGGSATYDGTAQTPSTCTVTGAYTGDLTCTNDPATAGPDVGTTTIDPVTAGSHLGDFDITSVSNTFTIEQAPTTTTISFGSGPFVFDGSAFTATASVTPAAAGTATITYSGDCTNAGDTCTAFAAYAGDANYEASSDTVAITIERAPVTATAGSGTSTYDGSAKAPPACTITGTYTGDLSCADDPATVGPDVGTTAIDPAVSGTGLANFAITSDPGSYTIEAAPTTTAVSFGAGPFVFDGSAFTATAAVSPAAAGTATVAYSGDCTNAGDTCTATATFAGTTDYLTSSDTVTITIDPAPVKATAGSGTATYDGAAKAPQACTVTGAYTGDLSCTDDPGSVGPDVGTTTIAPTVGGIGLANYAITSVDGSYTISPAPVTATAGSGSSTYDGTAKSPPACKVTGAFTGDLTCANSPGSVGPNAGTTTIAAVVSGSHLGDFAIASASGSYTIAPATTTTTVTFGAGPFVFDGAPFTATAAVAPAAAGTATITYSGDCTNPGTTCTATASYAGTGNYKPSSATATITIVPEYYICGQGGNAGSSGNGVIVVRVSICNIHGTNVGSPSLTVRAVGITPAGTPSSPGNSNPGNLFRLTGTAYAYNLDTKGLAPGSYTLDFTVGNDPTENHYAFTVTH